MMHARFIQEGTAQGEVLASNEPLSFWGGVDPATGTIIDAHHPLHGQCLTGKILMLPSSRGSCTGSGVLLDLALNDRAPAAILFCDAEDVLTLGAMVSAKMFDRVLPVIRLSKAAYSAFAAKRHVAVSQTAIEADGLTLTLSPPQAQDITLTPQAREILDGASGKAAQIAMDIILAMAANQGATDLVEVSRGHIDGCIYASPANLTFAEKMVELGAQIIIPTTMNAISVDRENWRAQGVPDLFGGPAQALGDAYVKMGARPTFTCAPYLLSDASPKLGEDIAWAESNAVIFANSVLGARSAKHPDFLDLFIAMTGFAPRAGVYLDEARKAQVILEIDDLGETDDLFWPLLGWIAGKYAPDCIPLLRGPKQAETVELQALCAAFGTTSAAPMLHVDGITPEASRIAHDAPRITITRADFVTAFETLNQGGETIDLVAIGSPHASSMECRRFLAHLTQRKTKVPTIITAGRAVISELDQDGSLAALKALGVDIVPDLCWCSISEPVFPPMTRNLMTNSGKYAHYGPGLSGRQIRFDSLHACAEAAVSGHATKALPRWLLG